MENMAIFADNCEGRTLDMIRSLGLGPQLTFLGNSASFRHVMEYAIGRYSPDQAIYLLEDDYFHLEGSAECILEGLEIADYVTLYDHPDKYRDRSAGGNRYVRGGGENSKVFLTNSTHWKKTNSTTMTYACKVGTLKQDFSVWKKHSRKNSPKDFFAFRELGRRRLFAKKRLLISSIPARSTHAEVRFLSPIIDWGAVKTE